MSSLHAMLANSGIPSGTPPARAHWPICAVALSLLAALALACAAGCNNSRAIPKRQSRPALAHIVLISLGDPAQAQALIADTKELLHPIPGVTRLVVGPHVDTGRPSVDGSYDVGILVEFPSAEDYAAYVAHPKHGALVERWKPRIVSMRTFDFLDHTPRVPGHAR